MSSNLEQISLYDPPQKVEQKRLHEKFIEIINKCSRFSTDSSCPEDIARSYMKNFGHDLSRAMCQSLKTNYDNCEAVVEEMMKMFLLSSESRSRFYYSKYYGKDDHFLTTRFYFDPISGHSIFKSVHEHLWDDKDFVIQAVFGYGKHLVTSDTQVSA